MSGKPYTAAEMKIIVDYLTEHKLYNEIKGRKMWMDFANTTLTSRTWQSLKETFLKRIMPDLANPYYKLSIEQICSFREAKDVTANHKSKLEMEPVDNHANMNGTKLTDDEKPSTSKKLREEMKTGETTNTSKINPDNRDSTETLILEVIDDDETKEMSRKNETANEAPTTGSKKTSLRDLITYTEPLTPLLQNILHDFTTDEDSEPKMVIDENPKKLDEDIPESQSILTVNKSENPEASNTSNRSSDNTEINSKQHGKKKQVKTKKKDKDYGSWRVVQSTVVDKSAATQNSADSVLPNNQEELQIKNNTEQSSNNHDEEHPPESPKNKKKKASKLQMNKDKQTVVNKSAATQNSADSILPNNQEQLQDKLNVEKNGKNHDKESLQPKSPKKSKKNKTSKLKSNKLKQSNITITNQVDEKSLQANENSSQEYIISMPIPEKIIKENNNTKGSDSDDIILLDQNTNEDVKMEGDNLKDITGKGEVSNEMPPSPVINPCLQSVSLYEEQFSQIKYLSSSDNENDKKIESPAIQESKQINEDKAKNINFNLLGQVVLLNSHSESETEDEEKISTNILTKERGKVLEQVFGLTSDKAAGKKKQMSHNRKENHYNPVNTDSSDSDNWTSESDDYVSSPRGRRNRRNRKYSKPHSSRIKSLEENGGLFVMRGNRIYPMMRDAKVLKNLVMFQQDSGSEEENYWKLKYVEEKKKSAELEKQMSNITKKGGSENNDMILVEQNLQVDKSKPPEIIQEQQVVPAQQNLQRQHEDQPDQKPVKIKFVKNNNEVQLEGLWTNIHPVLEQVVQMFHKEPDTPQNENKKVAVPVKRKSTSSDLILFDEASEHVNNLEEEIFKQIEDLANAEQNKENKSQVEEPNVNANQRKRRKTSISSTSSRESISSPKKPTMSLLEKWRNRKGGEGEKLKESATKNKPSRTPKPTVDNITEESKEPDNNIEEQKSDVRENPHKTVNNPKGRTPSRVSSRASIIPQKYIANIESLIPSESKKKSKATSRSNSKKREVVIDEDDNENVRYKFPSPEPSSSKKSGKRIKNYPKIFVSPQNASLQSINSTLGYQDTDQSPLIVQRKNKRRVSGTKLLLRERNRLKRNIKRNSLPNYDESKYTNDSNSRLKYQSNITHSSNSEAYRSDSYQILMPKYRINEVLEKIDENIVMGRNDKHRDIIGSFSSLPDLDKEKLQVPKLNNESDNQSNAGNSSNISLPLSPELSIVENLSISKHVLSSVDDDHPTINEMAFNDADNSNMLNKYTISKVDVTMPLMQQEISLKKARNCQNVTENTESYASDVDMPTDPFSSSADHVNIQPTVFDSLDQRLHDLLLESAKKISIGNMPQIQEEIKVDKTEEPKKNMAKTRSPVNATKNQVQQGPDVDKTEESKKTKPKRSSTPKRQRFRRPKATSNVPVIEEERMEHCVRKGRRSCPPVIQIADLETAGNLDQTNMSVASKPKVQKKKKDIIRVKILRPKTKKNKSKSSDNLNKNSENNLVTIQSGINDTESGVFLRESNDSIDLIHNHTETCLQTKECIDNSVEFIEVSVQSPISLNSTQNSKAEEILLSRNINVPPEAFCNNAQDGTKFDEEILSLKTCGSGTATIYHTPKSDSSLITEDLSPETRPKKSRLSSWHFFSEENTEYFDVNSQNNDVNISVGSNLNDIFPIVCTIPDLSTITELSKEGGDSRKTNLEVAGDIRSSSSSIFNI